MALSPTAMLRKPLLPLKVDTSCGAQMSSPLTCALVAAGSSAGGTMLTWVSCATSKLGIGLSGSFSSFQRHRSPHPWDQSGLAAESHPGTVLP